ncbi:MAG: twin-arginine translocase subunit TatB [Hyphomicrobiaceae bacterium]|nr:twin-arginine translocase subunit TatB [Hyphomicrobiaceae bacterium]
MLEIGWSELLILAVVTLLFVGPKELPVFLRTIGRYAGILRRHASDFRAQFDAAMREAELDAMKEEMKKMQASVNAEVMGAEKALKDAGQATALQAGAHSASAAAASGQPGSFTAAAAAAVFPTPAPTGQVYVRPKPEGDASSSDTAAPAEPVSTATAGQEHDSAKPAAAKSDLPDPASVPMPSPANPET